jgi:hypothetical protein
MHYVLDGRTPRPVGLLEWAIFLEDIEARRVDFDRRGAVEISTVFLGLDHQWGAGPPLLFETMVFGGPLDGECQRYATFADAEAGHTAMLVRVLDADARQTEARGRVQKAGS